MSNVAKDRTNATLCNITSQLRAHGSNLVRRLHLSYRRTPRPVLRKRSDKEARIALGRTYSDISPLLLPCSSHMLAPHAKLPANVHPKGPSQKSWEIQGIRRARARVRVRQTVIHIDDTNEERNDALRRTLSNVFRSSDTRKSLRGLVRSIGRTWTCKRSLSSHVEAA